MKNTSSPLVSILMPVYNAMPYLKACLDSILGQSLQEWELIAVDDFSTDDSLAVLQAYTQYDTRIKVYPNTSKGIISALRKAYEHSSADYVSRMDADDIMPSEKIELLYSKALENPDACITGKVEYFSDDTVQEGYLKYAQWLNTMVDESNHYNHIYKECVVPSPCWMLSRDMLEKIDAFRPDRYPEDYDLVFRMYAHRIPIIGIDRLLHYWRDHSDRASRNDEHYADQKFYELKMHYFLQLDYNQNKKLILWGAGRNGKQLAMILAERLIPFTWVTDNTNKIGHNIYGVILQPEADIYQLENAQIIIAIHQKGFLKKKRESIESLKEKNILYQF